MSNIQMCCLLPGLLTALAAVCIVHRSFQRVVLESVWRSRAVYKYVSPRSWRWILYLAMETPPCEQYTARCTPISVVGRHHCFRHSALPRAQARVLPNSPGSWSSLFYIILQYQVYNIMLSCMIWYRYIIWLYIISIDHIYHIIKLRNHILGK